MRKEAIYVVLIVIFSLEVIAVSMSPSDINLDFEPNLRKSFSFDVAHRWDYATNVTFYAAGDLKEYVTLDKKSEYFEKPGNTMLEVRISLPRSLDKAGQHVIRIGAKDNPTFRPEGVISATLGVEALIRVNVPYPGKYAEIMLEAINVNLGDDEQFKIYFSNLGKEDIHAIRGNIFIYDADENEVAKIRISHGIVKSGDEAVITARMKTDGFKAGAYKAIAILDYDGKKTSAETSFRIGDLLVELVNWTDIIRKGGIYPVDLWVVNLWSEELDVYADVIISKNKEIVSSLRSPTTRIKPFSSTRLNVYWDTRGKDGSYEMEVNLKYKDKINTKNVNIEVRGFEFNLNLILLILIILLIIIDAIWLVRKKSNKKKKRR